MNENPLSPGLFFGEPQSARQVGGLTLTEYRYAPDQQIPSHSHRLAYFCIVLQGSYVERYGSRERDCFSSMLIGHPEGETHSDRFQAEGGHIFSVEADQEWLSGVRDYAPTLLRPCEVRGGAGYAAGLRLFREFSSPDSASMLVIEAMALEILAEMARNTSRSEKWRPVWLRKAEEYLRERYREEIGLEALAVEAGVHRCHLARTFQQYYHCTAGEFVRQLRIEHACRRLRDGNTEIASLADELGFADASHFTRVFRRLTGYTPAEYRRAICRR